MQNKFVRILAWLAAIAVFTLFAMGIWLIACGGSQTTVSLKWLQLLQTLGTFLLPPVLCAWMWDSEHKPFTWLNMDKGARWKVFAKAVLIMLCAIPAINLLAEWNSRIELPESLGFIEQKLREMEDSAAQLTERFMQTDTVWGLILNIGLMALLPAFAEEMSFRGTMQQIFSPVSGKSVEKISRHAHVAIWVTATVFSAIHLQFYGFIPRMLMGALFGYMFVLTGTLWVPILMHFTNNCIAVISYYVLGPENIASGVDSTNIADTIGAGDTWWLGLLSMIIVTLLVWSLTSRGQQGFGRRTRTQ